MSKKNTSYQRFPLARRIEHIVMLLSFAMLATTGLPQKYPLYSRPLGRIYSWQSL